MRFRAPDSPAPSERLAETHKTYAVSPRNRLHGDGAWVDISVSTVVRAFTKAGIITELPGNSSDTDSDNDEGAGHVGCRTRPTVQFGH